METDLENLGLAMQFWMNKVEVYVDGKKQF
jgi:hypothetical protein